MAPEFKICTNAHLYTKINIGVIHLQNKPIQNNSLKIYMIHATICTEKQIET